MNQDDYFLGVLQPQGMLAEIITGIKAFCRY